MERGKRLYGVQALRGLACLGIVIAHSWAYAEFNFDELTAGVSLELWGRYGLLNLTDIFFAISGFFLSASISRIREEEPVGTLRFLKNRAMRIYPAYWMVMLTAILLRLIFQGSITSNGRFIWTLTLLPIPGVPYLLRCEWTLLVEMVFFAGAALAASPRRKRLYPTLMGLWTCAIVAALITGRSNFDIVATFPAVALTGRALSFPLGALLFYVYREIKKRTKERALPGFAGHVVLCGLLWLFLADFQYGLVNGQMIMTLRGRMVHYLIVSAAVLCAAFLQTGPKDPLVVLGDSSYTVYLIHPTVLDIYYYLFNRWGYHFNWLICAAGICAALLAGLGLARAEKRLNRVVRSWAARPRRERRPLRQLPWPRYAAVLLLAAVTAGCYVRFQAGVYIRQRPSAYAAEDYDSARLAGDELNAGYVDNVKQTAQEDGSVIVTADGWAYDAPTGARADRIAVVADGKSIPVSVSWHDRPGVGEAIGADVPLSSGFTLVTRPVPAPERIGFYLILQDGRLTELPVSS